MDYQEYLDSLIDKNLYEEKDEIFRILSNEYQNPTVKNYEELREVVFEFLLALHEEDDFASILKFKELLEEHYQEIFDTEYGQFADILIPYHISTNQDEEAKLMFDTWCAKNYDYDSMLILLNRLAHYGKDNWVAEYIEREYGKIKNSPELIYGAEGDLASYKVMLEFGKLMRGNKSREEALEELAKYEVKLSEFHEYVIATDQKECTFNKERQKYVFSIICEFQKYLNKAYNLPYLTSAVIMDSLYRYYEHDKYHNVATYFKIRENSFVKYMNDNSVNGITLNRESNFAMLFTLPIFYQFLTEKQVFKDTDKQKEIKKVDVLLKKYKLKNPSISNIFDGLEIYKLDF